MPLHRTYKLHDDKVLWPEHKSLEEVLALKATTPPNVWATTYQGDATNPAGTIFQREWWQGKNRFRSTILSPCVARWISGDTGLNDTNSSAKSALVVGELLDDYRLRIVDVWAEAVQFPQLVSKTRDWMVRYNQDGKLHVAVIERKVSGISLIQTLQQSIGDDLSSLVVGFDPKVSKETRYQQASVWCSLGCVLIPDPATEFPWLFDFETDLYECPNIRFLDVMDAFSQLIIYTEHLLSSGYEGRKGRHA